MDERSGGDVLAAGTRLEEFEIDRELGAGGFGVTYLAHDRSLGRRVAIKEYLPRDWGARGPDGGVGPRSATDAQNYRWGLGRFLEEARALARLRHAHVLQVYRVVEARGTAYMVTEYVEGRSLAEALRAEGPWAEARVLALLDALTAGLAAVHGAGLVHRDVKPANVMLRGDGSPVLIDFGSARQAVVGRSRSVTTVLTPGYAPFEQYSTKGVQGPWTDVYALGAVAYEALSGRVPEEAPARLEDDTLRPVSEVAPRAVSARSSSAVMSALALRREDRPQSLADWRARLGLPAAGDTGARAVEPPPSPKSSLPSVLTVPWPPVSGPVAVPRRRWRLAVVSAAAAVALAAAGLAWWAGGGRGGPEVVSGRADTAVAAPGTGARNGSGSSPAANETGSAPEEPAPEEPEEPMPEEPEPEEPEPDVAPEAVEGALGLDRAGWRRMQEGLLALGLDPGASDGLVGGGTRRAVRAYQAGAGKPATGFLDAADVATLRHAALEAAEAERQRLEAAEAERQRLEAAETERQRLEAAEAAAEAERQRLAAAEAERQRLEAEARRRTASWRPGRVFRDCEGCPEMVVVPAGNFLMGSPASEEGHDDDEGPQHRVTLRSFALGVTEVTFDEWAACVGGGGCNGYRPGDRGWGRGARPVIYVSWEDAQAYVSWLSAETGAAYRLPSESEWEYAARAGTTTPFHTGAAISPAQANYGGNRTETTSVKTFAPNRFGLYDVHGNVLEWVEDCWHDGYRGAPSDGTARTVGGGCGRRVLRGGSWNYNPRYLRSAARERDVTGSRLPAAGFRVARTLD